MPISPSLSARFGPGPAPAPAPPARWSPYARPSEPRRSGCAKASRPSLRLEPATARILGPARRAESRGSAFGAAAPSPARRRLGDLKKSDQKTDPKPAGTNTEPIHEPRVEESRACGGFAFLCALAGHKEAITVISMPMGSDKLYSGSADGSVRVWDGKSGKAWNIQTGMKLSLQGPSGLVCSMTIKDEMLFAGTADGRIMAWKFPAKEINSEPVAILAGHDRHVISLAVSATRLYSGSLDKTIRVWDLKNLQCVQTLSEHKAAVTSVLCWGQKLLSCSLDKTVKVCAASESGDLQLMHTHSEEHGVRTLFGMHRPGKMPVLLCSLHKQLRSPVGPAIVSAIQNTLFEEIGRLSSKTEVKTIELAQGPSRLLFTGDGAGELKMWMWAPRDEESPCTGAAINIS